MREEEFRTWLESRIYNGKPLSPKAITQRIRWVRRVERELANMDCPKSSLDALADEEGESWLNSTFGAYLQAPAKMPVSLVPEAPDPRKQLENLHKAARMYLRFARGEDPNGTDDLDLGLYEHDDDFVLYDAEGTAYVPVRNRNRSTGNVAFRIQPPNGSNRTEDAIEVDTVLEVAKAVLVDGRSARIAPVAGGTDNYLGYGKQKLVAYAMSEDLAEQLGIPSRGSKNADRALPTVLERFRKNRDFRAAERDWTDSQRSAFLKLTQDVHDVGLDWWFVNIPHTPARFGRKDKGKAKAHAVIGYLRAADATIRLNTRQDAVSLNVDAAIALDEQATSELSTALISNKEIIQRELPTSFSRPGYWPDEIEMDDENKVLDTTPIWLVTALDGQTDGLEGFIEREDWHLLYDNGSKYNRMVREMQPGDRIVMRDFLGNQRNPPFQNNGVPVTAMRIRATGVVTQASEDGLSVAVDWTRLPEERLWWLYTNNDTIWQLPVAESELARRLAAFIFDGEEQDIAWFLNDPYWRGRFLAQTQDKPMPTPTNLILYGPPGTGKTYTTARKAVELCDGTADYPDDETGRAVLMERYRQLQKEKRIGFVTFHQNFAYEDFVEGLRPVTGGDEQASAGFTLKPEPGIFKELCALSERARKHPLDNTAPADALNLTSRNFWKMSIGNSGSEDEIYEDAVKGNHIALGWASAEDWSDPRYGSMDAIKEQWLSKPRESSEPSNWSQTHRFRNVMQPGDIVIVPYGNSAFRAVGEVTGPYRYDSECDGYYANKRAVRWLLTLDEPLPLDTIVEGNFTMRSLYPLPSKRINIPALNRLIAPAAQDQTSAPVDATIDQFILIIDEINRANISKVFGELITLLEPDKRLGMPNALTVRLPYSKTEFGVPANLHVIGTMNTADRSIALLDTALRRRFTFREMAPRPDLLETVDGIDLSKVLTAINQRIEYLVDREHRIGHAFFMGCTSREQIDTVMRDKVIPLLQEYFFEDWGRIRSVVGAGFIDESEIAPPPGFDGEPRKSWSVRSAFKPDAYARLLNGITPDDEGTAPDEQDEEQA